MKFTALFSLLATATALATHNGYSTVSTVFPPSHHRSYFAPSYDVGLTYEGESSYASVPGSSLNIVPVKRVVPSYALASVKKHKPSYAPAHSYSYTPVKKAHDYGYSVSEDGNSYGHQESNDGYTTKGSYYVDLPDGRRQKVTYYVNGDSGFVAEVTYEGVAHYPAPKAVYYKPAAPYKHGAHAPSHEYLVSSAHLPSPFYA